MPKSELGRGHLMMENFESSVERVSWFTFPIARNGLHGLLVILDTLKTKKVYLLSWSTSINGQNNNPFFTPLKTT